MTMDDRVECRNPDPDKQPTRIDRWKYDAVRSAILEEIGRGAEGVEFRGLAEAVRNRLSGDHRQRLGSVSWYITVVKLDLEARGEIERVSGARPQWLRRTP